MLTFCFRTNKIETKSEVGSTNKDESEDTYQTSEKAKDLENERINNIIEECDKKNVRINNLSLFTFMCTILVQPSINLSLF